MKKITAPEFFSANPHTRIKVEVPTGALALNVIFAHRVNFEWNPADEKENRLTISTEGFKTTLDHSIIGPSRGLSSRISSVLIQLARIRDVKEPAWAMDYLRTIVGAIIKGRINLRWSEDDADGSRVERHDHYTGKRVHLDLDNDYPTDIAGISFDNADQVRNPPPEHAKEFIYQMIYMSNEHHSAKAAVAKGLPYRPCPIHEAFNDLNDKWTGMELRWDDPKPIARSKPRAAVTKVAAASPPKSKADEFVAPVSAPTPAPQFGGRLILELRDVLDCPTVETFIRTRDGVCYASVTFINKDGSHGLEADFIRDDTQLSCPYYAMAGDRYTHQHDLIAKLDNHEIPRTIRFKD